MKTFFLKIRPSEQDKAADKFARENGLIDRPFLYRISWKEYRKYFALNVNVRPTSIDCSSDEKKLVYMAITALRSAPNNSVLTLTHDQLSMVIKDIDKLMHGHEWQMQNDKGEALTRLQNQVEFVTEYEYADIFSGGNDSDFVTCKKIDHPNGDFYDDGHDGDCDGDVNYDADNFRWGN